MAASDITNPPLKRKWCHSHFKTIPFSYLWTIDNFSSRRDNPGASLESSTFWADNYEEAKWRLVVYPVNSKKKENELEDSMSIFLKLLSEPSKPYPYTSAPEVRITVEISILNAQNKKEYTAKITRTFKEPSSYGWPKFIDNNSLIKSDKLLPDDTLTLLCEGSIVVKENVNTYGDSELVELKVPACTALCDYGLLLESRKFSDVTISAGDKEIQAHKVILAARSSVFSAMFDSQMKEEIRNRIEITDVEPQVIHEMLRFMYTGEAPSIKEMAADLFVAADKYDLGRLKVMCVKELFQTLGTGNAVDILILADRHSEEQLKAEAISFINTHVKRVILTPSYKLMANSHPHLIDESFRASAAKRKCNSHECAAIEK